MADDDEDLATLHWGEDPTTPLLIVMQLLRQQQQQQEATRGPAGGAKESGAPPTLRQNSAQNEYQEALAAVRKVVPEDGPYGGFWVDLQRLRTYLEAKEHIHICYVKIGFMLKIVAQERGRRWATAGRILDLETPGRAILSAPVHALLRAIEEDGLLKHEGKDEEGKAGQSGNQAGTSSPSSSSCELNRIIAIAEHQRNAWLKYVVPYWAGAGIRRKIKTDGPATATLKSKRVELGASYKVRDGAGSLRANRHTLDAPNVMRYM